MGTSFELIPGTGVINTSDIQTLEFDISAESQPYSVTILPPSMPLIDVTPDEDRSVCINDTPYSPGPEEVRSICKVLFAVDVQNTGSGISISYSSCSGTFIGAKDGGLMFWTAAHCAVNGTNSPFLITSPLVPNEFISFVQCNQTSGVSDKGSGYFSVIGATIDANFDATNFAQTNAYDGTLLLVKPLSGTDLNFAQPYYAAAITTSGLGVTRSNYNGGFPAEDNRLEGCASPPLDSGLGEVLFYSRDEVQVQSSGVQGIFVNGFSGCGGNSGGPIMAEDACVTYGSLSAATVACNADGESFLVYSRIVTASSTDPGVDLEALISNLAEGDPVFV